jgi:methylmalonyl-CoA mutase cobalamin-binding domain/chain
VYAGGIIPDADLPTILEMGVRGVFGPGTPLEAIVSAIRDGAVAERATRGL